MSFISAWAEQTWEFILEAAPWLLGGFVLAGITYVLVPAEMVSRHLGKRSSGSVVKASLLGIPLPLCSCSVIPMASAIHKQGASKGATAGFLISTPETGVDSIAISYALLGPMLAILRPIAAFVTAVIAGTLINRLDTSRSVPPDESPESGAPAGRAGQSDSQSLASRCCDDDVRRPNKLIRAVRFGLVDMFVDLSHWLAAGFALAGLAAAAIPQGWIEGHIGSGPAAIFLMLLVGLPTYICATSSTPVAAALIAQGLSPGAALVFLLAGPATNMTTMAVVARDLGRRSLILYLLSIALVAVTFGLAVDWMSDWSSIPFPGGSHHRHPTKPTFVSGACGVALLALMLNGLRLRITSKVEGRKSKVEG